MAEQDNDLRFLIDLARGRFSRRDALKATGALGAGAASSSALFIAARILGGLGVGAASVLSPKPSMTRRRKIFTPGASA